MSNHTFTLIFKVNMMQTRFKWNKCIYVQSHIFLSSLSIWCRQDYNVKLNKVNSRLCPFRGMIVFLDNLTSCFTWHCWNLRGLYTSDEGMSPKLSKIRDWRRKGDQSSLYSNLKNKNYHSLKWMRKWLGILYGHNCAMFHLSCFDEFCNN